MCARFEQRGVDSSIDGSLYSFRRSLSVTLQDCVVGSGGKSVGYLAHGTATDFMFEKLGVPVTSTWEIFGDLQVSVEGESPRGPAGER